MIYDIQQMYYDFEEDDLRKGRKLYASNKVHILKVEGSYSQEDNEPIYSIEAQVESKAHTITKVSFCFYEGCICNSNCECSQFDYDFDYFYEDYYVTYCSHIAAVVFAVVDYFQEHPEVILPNRSLMELLDIYTQNAIASTKAKLSGQMELEPIIESESGEYKLSFKVGNRKKYVVKNLYAFSEAFEKGETLVYGKNFEVVHHMDAFTPKSQQLIQFIRGKVEENNTFMEEFRLMYYGRMPAKRSIMLTPGIMDEFFSIVGEGFVSWNDKDSGDRRKAQKTVRMVAQNLVVHVSVERFNPSTLFSCDEAVKSTGFTGVQVRTNVDGVIEGNKHVYVLSGDELYQCDDDFKAKMEPFLKLMAEAENYLPVATPEIGHFYRFVLDRLKPYIALSEYDVEEISQQMPPEAEFAFYLDRDKENVTCKVIVKYGEQEYPLRANRSDRAGFCDIPKEMKIESIIEHWLPYYDEFDGIYHCAGNEEMVYDFLNEGITEFTELGEVYISDSLKALKVNSSPKVSIGVTVKSNLLDLTVHSDDYDFAELKDVLKSYHLKKRYHRLKNGDFLNLEENSMATLMEMMDMMQLSVKELTKGKLKIPAYRALYLDKMLQVSKGISYESDRELKAMLRDFKAVEDCDYEIPAEMESILRNYQKTGYQWLRTMESYHFGGILADDMGLGKTLQVISVLLGAKHDGKTGTSLIVCPASLVYNWENEIHRFAPSLTVKVIAGTIAVRNELLGELGETDIVITSYDLLKRDIEAYEEADFLYHIIDEAQYIKNPETQVAKSVKLIHSKTRFALTGTPIENRLSELWSIFDFLMPGFLYKYEQFRKRIETPIIRNKDEEITLRLKKMVAPFILRRLKKDVLKDLPDKIEQVTYAKMEQEQRKIYEAYVEKVRMELKQQSDEEFHQGKLKILAELTRLRQICCEPALIYDNYTTESGKMATCMELLHNAADGNHKVLLFSQFTSMLSIIEERLKKEGISYYVITGKTKKEERIRLVNQFNEDDTTVFLISLKAGGTGLNLTGADIVIHYDPWWNVAAQNQATDRAHRIGQKNVVTVFQLITQNSIEEKIVMMQQAKKDLADQIISGDTNQLQNMTREDFEELLSW